MLGRPEKLSGSLCWKLHRILCLISRRHKTGEEKIIIIKLSWENIYPLSRVMVAIGGYKKTPPFSGNLPETTPPKYPPPPLPRKWEHACFCFWHFDTKRSCVPGNMHAAPYAFEWWCMVVVGGGGGGTPLIEYWPFLTPPLCSPCSYPRDGGDTGRGSWLRRYKWHKGNQVLNGHEINNIINSTLTILANLVARAIVPSSQADFVLQASPACPIVISQEFADFAPEWRDNPLTIEQAYQQKRVCLRFDVLSIIIVT